MHRSPLLASIDWKHHALSHAPEGRSLPLSSEKDDMHLTSLKVGGHLFGRRAGLCSYLRFNNRGDRLFFLAFCGLIIASAGGDWRAKGKNAIIANKINLLSFEIVYGSKIMDKIGSWRKTRYRDKNRKGPPVGLDDPDADCLQSP
jgi:hypothetical protein